MLLFVVGAQESGSGGLESGLLMLFSGGVYTEPVNPTPVITFSLTARDIVTRAMNDRRVLAGGRDPKAWEMQYGIQTLNLMFKTWAAKGVSLWTDEDGYAIVTAGNASVPLSPRPIDVLEVSLLLAGPQERQMTRWEKGDYATLPNKLQKGDPLIYSPVYTAAGVSLRVWPVPTVDRTLTYSYARVIADVIEPSDPVDIPQMWLETVIKVLASKLDTFGGDPNHIATLKAEAAFMENQMLDHDRPASYWIGREP